MKTVYKKEFWGKIFSKVYIHLLKPRELTKIHKPNW